MIYKKHFTKQLFNFLFIIIIGFVFFSSCKTKKPLVTNTFNKSLNTIKKTDYNLTIIPNSKLFISKDNFNITNVKQQKGQNLILKFTYKTQPPKNVADANYSEVLFIEIPNSKQNINITQFNNINIWFARFCYCKDYVGFFRILNGNLNLSLNKNYLKIKLQFKFNNIPKILNFINQKIALNTQ